jgi:hypothetical protein
LGDDFTVEVGIAEGNFSSFGSPIVELHIVIHGEADSTVDLVS